MAEIIKNLAEGLQANRSENSIFQVPISLALGEDPTRIESLGEPNLIYSLVEGVGESDTPLAVGVPRRWQWSRRIWPVAMRGGPLSWEFAPIRRGDVAAKGSPTHWEWQPASFTGRIAEGPRREETVTIHPSPPLELPAEDMSAWVEERMTISQP